MTASGVAISLLMVGAMLVLIMVNGLGQFWPAPLHQIVLKTQEIVIGQVVGQEIIPQFCDAGQAQWTGPISLPCRQS